MRTDHIALGVASLLASLLAVSQAFADYSFSFTSRARHDGVGASAGQSGGFSFGGAIARPADAHLSSPCLRLTDNSDGDQVRQRELASGKPAALTLFPRRSSLDGRASALECAREVPRPLQFVLFVHLRIGRGYQFSYNVVPDGDRIAPIAGLLKKIRRRHLIAHRL